MLSEIKDYKFCFHSQIRKFYICVSNIADFLEIDGIESRIQTLFTIVYN